MKFIHTVQNFITEGGEIFEELRLAYTTHGKLNEKKNNAIFVVHPFTASPDPMEWWSGIVGEGRVFDPSYYYIVCINVPGSPYGSTSPMDVNPQTGDPYFHDFPKFTPRDVVRAFEEVREHLNVEKIRIATGISMGGQIVFQWIHSCSKTIERAIIVAANPRITPWMLASHHVQRNAIMLDPTWQSRDPDAGKGGMKIARQIGFLSYRSPRILSLSHVFHLGKFNNADEQGFSFKGGIHGKKTSLVRSYIEYQGEKFLQRFNAFSYLSLLSLMDSHDIGYRGMLLEHALKEIQTDVLLIGIDSDMLFPPEELLQYAPQMKRVRYRELSSIYGHDAILIEYKQLEDIIIDYLHEIDDRHFHKPEEWDV